ncbi:LysR substrate-binding domain-containing protein [Streptomyces endophyticus]|uniref:LysR substrate-binding domain-containing protein n=1 Tax=Streptomyces endophyticus TaxID=714166 RepID=A0ABU6FH28_9ACTN|nr:LysR substrate-binding domain-containing protein [Streptomyces endophyticus]MEB8343359.1 LysR substrate-binding domain-containing protein [Streptomyces endophyticus]
MELKHLTGFVAVAEELHFGRAAERLHIAQSPLSQQIKLLERDLGVKLFDRTTRTVRLTSAGQALVEPARRLLADASAVHRTVRAAHLGEVGRVSVGFAGASSYAALPLLTRAVTSQLPGIELVLEGQTYSGEALRRVTDGTLDIGFVALPVRRGITARVVRMERLVIALPDSHPLADLAEVPVRALADEPIVTFPLSRESAVRDAVVQACHDAGFAPRIAQEAPDSYNMLALVGAGVGVAVVVESARNIHLEHVVFRPLAGDEVPVLPIALGWRSGNPSAALKAVLRVAQDVLPTPGDAPAASEPGS